MESARDERPWNRTVLVATVGIVVALPVGWLVWYAALLRKPLVGEVHVVQYSGLLAVAALLALVVDRRAGGLLALTAAAGFAFLGGPVPTGYAATLAGLTLVAGVGALAGVGAHAGRWRRTLATFAVAGIVVSGLGLLLVL